MIPTVIAATLSFALVLLIARKSYTTGFDSGYHHGQREVLDRLEQRSLDRAHIDRYGKFIQAGREGRN
jgi:hypothetical protein